MILLSLCDNHDSGACILKDGELLFAVNEERLSRKKLQGGFPWLSVKACLKEAGVRILEVRHCPHAKKDRCICHKPSPYFIEKFCAKYEIDVRQSFCIGDHPHDIEMAKRCGARSVYLLTGHGAKHRGELISKPDHIAADLYEAAVWIMRSTVADGKIEISQVSQ